MVAADVELTHQRLQTPENRTSMMAKAIMPILDVLKGRIADTNQRLTSQYRMIQMAHHRYNLLFRWTHEMLTIHHFALLPFKNYLTIQVGMLQRIHRQYNTGFPLFRNHKIPGFFQDFSRNLTPFSRYIFALAANLQLQF